MYVYTWIIVALQIFVNYIMLSRLRMCMISWLSWVFFCTRNSRTCCPNEATANRCRHSPHPLDSVELKGLVKRPWWHGNRNTGACEKRILDSLEATDFLSLNDHVSSYQFFLPRQRLVDLDGVCLLLSPWSRISFPTLRLFSQPCIPRLWKIDSYRFMCFVASFIPASSYHPCHFSLLCGPDHLAVFSRHDLRRTTCYRWYPGALRFV